LKTQWKFLQLEAVKLFRHIKHERWCHNKTSFAKLLRNAGMEIEIHLMRFEVLTVGLVKIPVLWDMLQCKLVYCWCFGGAGCLPRPFAFIYDAIWILHFWRDHLKWM
jgi:hypothetical protein